MKRYIFFIAVIIGIFTLENITYAASDAFNAGFNQGMQSANALQGKAFNEMQNFKPEKTIEHYTEHPDETQYTANPNSIKPNAVVVRETNSEAKNIQASIYQHPAFNIKTDSPSMQQTKSNADAMYENLTQQFSGCTQKTTCTTSYQTQSCEESPKNIIHYCNKTLNVSMVSNSTSTDYSFSASFSTRWHNYAAAIFNLTTGDVIGPAPHDLVASLSGRLPSTVNDSSMSVFSRDKDTYISGFSVSGKNVNISLNGYPKNATIHFVIRVTTSTLSPSDQWNDGCIGFDNLSSCKKKEEHCVEANSTHSIDGISVARDCWEWEDSYACGDTNSSTMCDVLRDQGCEQTHSDCKLNQDGSCQQYTQTFRCPTKQCTPVGMICNNQTYCLDGGCVKNQKSSDPDFQRAISALSVANEAAKSFSQFNSIFKGERKTCDTFALGFLDCCADSGWGKNHIANCSQEEKDLKVAKDNLLTVYVGEYCKKNALGSCFEKRKAYCVFPSKLARIIQDQGRFRQLGIHFGTPEEADCRGVTSEEFSKLSLNMMDFSDFYSDIYKKENIETQDKLSQLTTDRVQSLSKGIHHD